MGLGFSHGWIDFAKNPQNPHIQVRVTSVGKFSISCTLPPLPRIYVIFFFGNQLFTE